MAGFRVFRKRTIFPQRCHPERSAQRGVEEPVLSLPKEPAPQMRLLPCVSKAASTTASLSHAKCAIFRVLGSRERWEILLTRARRGIWRNHTGGSHPGTRDQEP